MYQKTKNIAELIPIITDLKNKGKNVVFTNGCFDILHSGHVKYLYESKKLADILIIGLNSDASVKRLKGDSRPINKEQDRAIVLSALESVDYVVIFDEDTPYSLIQKILPNVLVKGGDWQEDSIVGADIVKANAGKVVSLNYYEGYSSTKVINELDKLRL